MAFGKEMMRGAVFVTALSFAPFALAQEHADTEAPQDTLPGIGVETCTPEGAALIVEGPETGQSPNGFRILLSINRHFDLIRQGMSRNENVEPLIDNMILAADGCTPQDYDSALRTLATSGFPQERIDFYTRMIAVMRTFYLDGAV